MSYSGWLQCGGASETIGAGLAIADRFAGDSRGNGHIVLGDTGSSEDIRRFLMAHSLFVLFGYTGLVVFGVLIALFIWAWLWRDGGYGG